MPSQQITFPFFVGGRVLCNILSFEIAQLIALHVECIYMRYDNLSGTNVVVYLTLLEGTGDISVKCKNFWHRVMYALAIPTVSDIYFGHDCHF